MKQFTGRYGVSDKAKSYYRMMQEWVRLSMLADKQPDYAANARLIYEQARQMIKGTGSQQTKGSLYILAGSIERIQGYQLSLKDMTVIEFYDRLEEANVIVRERMSKAESKP